MAEQEAAKQATFRLGSTPREAPEETDKRERISNVCSPEHEPGLCEEVIVCMRTLMTSPSFIRLTSPERQAKVAISSGPCTHAIGRLLFPTHCVRQAGLGGHPRVLISRPARRRHCRTGRRGGPRDDSWTRRSSSRPCPRPPTGPTRPALPSQATPGAVGSRPALRTQSLARTGRCRGCGGRPSRGATGTLSSPATGSATTARARPEEGSGETTTSTQSPPSTKFNQPGRRLD